MGNDCKEEMGKQIITDEIRKTDKRWTQGNGGRKNGRRVTLAVK